MFLSCLVLCWHPGVSKDMLKISGYSAKSQGQQSQAQRIQCYSKESFVLKTNVFLFSALKTSHLKHVLEQG